jgi:hypothetical protein
MLELSESERSNDILKTTFMIAEKYGNMAACEETLKVLSPGELEDFVDYVQKMSLTKEFVSKAFRDSLEFGRQIESLV